MPNGPLALARVWLRLVPVVALSFVVYMATYASSDNFWDVFAFVFIPIYGVRLTVWAIRTVREETACRLSLADARRLPSSVPVYQPGATPTPSHDPPE